LKALTDRVPAPARARLLAWYTSTFGIGSAVSLLLAGACATRLGWRAAFLAASGGPLLAMALVLWKLGPVPSSGKPGARLLSDVGAVLRNRPVVGWVIGYACHCWELFGLRSWIVAFLLPSCGGDLARAAAAAALLQLLGPPASIVGNEVSLRLGRRAVVLFAMTGSGLLATVLGATFAASWPVVLGAAAGYYLFVMFDSAALTAGVVAACDDARRGTTLAVHSFAGFASGCVAPIVFGATLQSLGGSAVPRAWLLAFVTLSAASLAGAFTLARWTSRSA
jgi:predicted MFS family arabinose efflux permease